MTVTLHCRDTGSGPPLVLLHAFPLSSVMFDEIRHRFAGGDGYAARVITPDARGFGGSRLGDTAGRPTLDEYAADIAALLDRLELDRVTLGGVSMGGYVAMAFARRHPDRIAGLALLDTKASEDTEEAKANRHTLADTVERTGSVEPLLTAVLPKLLGTTTAQSRPELAGRVRTWVEAASPPAVARASRAMAARPDSFGTLRAFDGPALVLVGEEDELSPVKDAEAMAAALPDAELVVVPATGHLAAVEDSHPVIPALARLLTRSASS